MASQEISRVVDDGKMNDEERARNIGVLKRIITALEEGRENDTAFIVSAQFEDDPDAVGIIWGPGFTLMHLLRNVGEPIARDLKRMLKEHGIKLPSTGQSQQPETVN